MSLRQLELITTKVQMTRTSSVSRDYNQQSLYSYSLIYHDIPAIPVIPASNSHLPFLFLSAESNEKVLTTYLFYNSHNRIVLLKLLTLSIISRGNIIGIASFFKYRLPEIQSYWDSSKWLLHIRECLVIRLFVGITCNHFFNKSSFFNGKLRNKVFKKY